jgi:hypothetical protein
MAESKTPLLAPCWICSAPADSGEHRMKKSDMVRAYGKGPYRGGAAPVHVFDGVQTAIQGPRSNTLKYEPSLCHNCNTTRTQTFDRAYDQFISWVLTNEDVVLTKRFINFA